MTPLIKWAGGKRSEIPLLQPHYPAHVQRLIEPFAGGAAVAWGLNATSTVLNDVNHGLITFYRTLQDSDRRHALVEALRTINLVRRRLAGFVAEVDDVRLAQLYQDPGTFGEDTMRAALAGLTTPFSLDALVALAAKHVRSKLLKRIPKLEASQPAPFSAENRRLHLETALQSSWYEALRTIYNDVTPCDAGWQGAAWWAVRTLCYSGMFRFAANGHFNVPYGGIAYNARDFNASIEDFNDPERLDFLARTTVESMDFAALFERYGYFGEGDFVFVDPPYDSAFSKYNHDGDFTRNDQTRLRDVLLRCQAPWMVVIKSTPFIEALYTQPEVWVHRFDKKYGANFRNRHERDVQHLIITNYALSIDQDTTTAEAA